MFRVFARRSAFQSKSMETQAAANKLEEVFDIFNESNELIGQELRSIVHKKGLFHRSVNVLVFNKDKELLLQKRADTKDVCPSLWDISCAEHLQPGESYEAAAKRGLKEELGIRLEDLENPSLIQMRTPELFVHKHWVKSTGTNDSSSNLHEPDIHDREFSMCYIVNYNERKDPALVMQPEELSDIRFICQREAVEECKRGRVTPWMEWEMKNYLRWLASGQKLG